MLKDMGAEDLASSIKLDTPSSTKSILSGWLTQDPDMIRLKQKVEVLANMDCPVLILGESGTGKEDIARALHGSREGNFVSINVTAMPDTLIESELFGHKAGSFTDAKSDRLGKLREAEGGTVFLDEIGLAPEAVQVKLLRALQSRTFTPVGADKEVTFNCRIVSATSRFDGEVVSGLFPDLYYRLAIVVLTVTPLRERVNDIAYIIRKKLDKDGVIGNELIAEWSSMQLNGNVRELYAKVTRHYVELELQERLKKLGTQPAISERPNDDEA